MSGQWSTLVWTELEEDDNGAANKRGSVCLSPTSMSMSEQMLPATESSTNTNEESRVNLYYFELLKLFITYIFDFKKG